MTYNRSQIMREAGRLMRLGWTRSEAMKAAWAAAKSAQLPTYSRQQEAGLKASLKRYGFDYDKHKIVIPADLVRRAQEAVRAIVAAIAQDRVALLRDQSQIIGSDIDTSIIDLTLDADGVYRI